MAIFMREGAIRGRDQTAINMEEGLAISGRGEDKLVMERGCGERRSEEEK